MYSGVPWVRVGRMRGAIARIHGRQHIKIARVRIGLITTKHIQMTSEEVVRYSV
jgi:hypothetical protein